MLHRILLHRLSWPNSQRVIHLPYHRCICDACGNIWNYNNKQHTSTSSPKSKTWFCFHLPTGFCRRRKRRRRRRTTDGFVFFPSDYGYDLEMIGVSSEREYGDVITHFHTHPPSCAHDRLLHTHPHPSTHPHTHKHSPLKASWWLAIKEKKETKIKVFIVKFESGCYFLQCGDGQ